MTRQTYDPHEIIHILFNIQNVLHTRYYSINHKEQRKLVQTRSQAKTSGTFLLKVHSIDKGIDPNIRLEKQVIKPVVTSQMHTLPETKIISHVKLRIGQGKVGIKRKMLKFPLSQSYDEPEQPNLLPGRKPIIQRQKTQFSNNLQILHNLKQHQKLYHKKYLYFWED